MRAAFGPDDKFTALVLERDFDIQAVCLYNQYEPNSTIDLHIAAVGGRRWMTRDFLRATFYYPFEQLKVRRIGALVASNNTDSLRLTRHVGFQLEGIAREAWAPGVDVVCFGMLKHECHWLDGKVPQIWSVKRGQTVTAETTRPHRNGSGTISR